MSRSYELGKFMSTIHVFIHCLVKNPVLETVVNSSKQFIDKVSKLFKSNKYFRIITIGTVSISGENTKVYLMDHMVFQLLEMD